VVGLLTQIVAVRVEAELTPISGTEWIDARYAELTPKYWREHFSRKMSSWSPPPRTIKALYEHYHASAFSWWIETERGVHSIFCLQDAQRGVATGHGPDCEFRTRSIRFWVEMFSVYYPLHKLELPARLGRFDKLVRAELASLGRGISITYESYLSIPADIAARNRLAITVGKKLADGLLTAELVTIDEPIRIKAETARMAMTVYGSSDDASPSRARVAFAEQMERQLCEARRKLAPFDLNRRCVLIITDNHTNAPTEVAEAFGLLTPSLYVEIGGVFWLNASRPPFSVQTFHEHESLWN